MQWQNIKQMSPQHVSSGVMPLSACKLWVAQAQPLESTAENQTPKPQRFRGARAFIESLGVLQTNEGWIFFTFCFTCVVYHTLHRSVLGFSASRQKETQYDLVHVSCVPACTLSDWFGVCVLTKVPGRATARAHKIASVAHAERFIQTDRLCTHFFPVPLRFASVSFHCHRSPLFNISACVVMALFNDLWTTPVTIRRCPNVRPWQIAGQCGVTELTVITGYEIRIVQKFPGWPGETQTCSSRESRERTRT